MELREKMRKKPDWLEKGAKVMFLAEKAENASYKRFPDHYVNVPEDLTVYTVREYRYSETALKWCILLEELVNPICHYVEGQMEGAFKIDYFEPVWG